MAFVDGMVQFSVLPLSGQPSESESFPQASSTTGASCGFAPGTPGKQAQTTRTDVPLQITAIEERQENIIHYGALTVPAILCWGIILQV